MLQKLSKIVKLLLLALLSFHSQAQTYEWVNFFKSNNYIQPLSINVDGEGNQYSTFYFSNQIKVDTLSIGTEGIAGLVVKQDKNGKIIWYKIIRAIDNVKFHVLPMASMLNTEGNLVVIVSSYKDIVIVTDTIKSKDKNSFENFYRLEFNSAGKLINGLHLIGGSITETYLRPNLITSDKNDNLYISVSNAQQVKIYDVKGTTILAPGSPAYPRFINLKFSNSGQKLEWVSYLPNFYRPYSIKVDIDGNLYSSGCWSGSNSLSSFIFKGNKINNPQQETGVVFIHNKYGQDKNWFWLGSSSKHSAFYTIAVHDSNSVLVSGMYEGDSAKFGDKWHKNTQYGSYNFLAMFDNQGNSKWVKTEDTSHSRSFNTGDIPSITCMNNYKDSFYYVSIYMDKDYDNKSISFDGQKYLPDPKGNGLNMKLDDKGNILWAFRSQIPFAGMGTDNFNNLYFIGQGMKDTIKFGNFKSFPNNIDGYIGKTFDYAIYRGDVYAGPYCAGDSLYVPYSKIGIFGDDNIFFAEISDEFGNFTGKEREIGRLKTNANGTIGGVLPMFQVASSGNYRIRIRSTSPQGQSYYKFDKLRLLIYSRDKADPGQPAYICPGDTLQLNTWGGTKWTWSPKYNMDNPNLRQPLVWPSRDTTYKIIIGDSSGCGAPDTAYKKIYVTNNFKVNFEVSDVCENTNAIFLNKSPEFMGLTNYNWKFGDGQNSYMENPKHLYKINGVSTTFNVSLVLKRKSCIDSITKAVTINANPNSNFSWVLTGSKVDLTAFQTGFAKYLWKFGTTDSITTNTSTYSRTLNLPTQSKVCLKLIDAAGCYSQTCKNVLLDISSISKLSGFKIYPNPNTGNFAVEIENPANDASIELLNMLGHVVKKVEKVGKVTSINLEVANGIYLLRVKNGTEVWNQKVVVSFVEDAKR